MLPSFAALGRPLSERVGSKLRYKVYPDRVEMYTEGNEDAPVRYFPFNPYKFPFQPGAEIEWMAGTHPPNGPPSSNPRAHLQANHDDARREGASGAPRERDVADEAYARAQALARALAPPEDSESDEDFDPTDCLRLDVRGHCARDDRMRARYFEKHGHYGDWEERPQYRDDAHSRG